MTKLIIATIVVVVLLCIVAYCMSSGHLWAAAVILIMSLVAGCVIGNYDSISKPEVSYVTTLLPFDSGAYIQQYVGTYYVNTKDGIQQYNMGDTTIIHDDSNGCRVDYNRSKRYIMWYATMEESVTLYVPEESEVEVVHEPVIKKESWDPIMDSFESQADELSKAMDELHNSTVSGNSLESQDDELSKAIDALDSGNSLED